MSSDDEVSRLREALSKIAMMEPNRFFDANDLHRQLCEAIYSARIVLGGSRKPLGRDNGARNDGANRVPK